ncbi:MAG: hypothetical protein RLZZ450_5068 [Pseudomonadota bacterium]|jgi:tetratricopeptide (TPR) repeat protein
MATLGRFATNALEACWLASALLVPLFVNKDSEQAFDPAKAGLLQAIAVLMLVASTTKSLCDTAAQASDLAWRRRLRELLRGPLVLPIVALLFTQGLATIFSLAPSESLWGHRGRAQGLVTLASELSIFAATAANLRSTRQLRRLTTSLIVPSIPIVLYALCQRMQLEPMPVHTETEAERVTSLLGQPVHLAAYLGMIIPFTALRAREALVDGVHAWGQRALRISLYGLLLVLQTLALVFTESRGPILGLLVASALGLLALSAVRGWRRPVVFVWGLAAIAVLLIAVGLPARLRSLGSDVEPSHMAQRASETFALDGGGGTFRAVSWQVASRVLFNDAPLELVDGSHDPRPSTRRLFGYGPELQYAISPPFYDAALPRLFGYVLIDRYHNHLWDTLLTTGLFGLAAWLSTQAALLWLLMRVLGLVQTSSRRSRTGLFWTVNVGCALASAAAWVALRGVPYLFLGLQLGVALGLAIFLTIVSWQRRDRESPGRDPGLAVVCLVAVVSHLIETSFSFDTIATGALFWLVSALVVSCTRVPVEAQADTNEELREAVHDVVLLSWSLIAIGFTFLGAASRETSVGAVIWDGLTSLGHPVGTRAPVGAALVLTTLLLGATLLRLERPRGGLARTGGVLAATTALGLLYWLQQASALASRARASSAESFDFASQLSSRTSATTTFYVACLLLVVLYAAIGARASERVPHNEPPLRWWRGALSLMALLVGLFTVEYVSLRPAHADIAVALGDSLQRQNRLEQAELAYGRAITQLPRDDAYQAMLARAYLKHARLDAPHASAWLERAEQTFREAIALNPAASEYATNLAAISQQRMLLLGAAQRAPARSSLVDTFARALRLNPFDPSLWRLWGATQLGLLADPHGALASAQRALTLRPNEAAAYALLGESQVALARAQSGESGRERMLAAADAYEKAAELAPAHASYRVYSGQAYLAIGQASKAAVAFRSALSSLPPASKDRQATLGLLRRAEAAKSLTTAPAAP